MFMQEAQRVTFVWKNTPDGLKITHIHLSNTMHAVKDDEDFPVEASKRNYTYVQKKAVRTRQNAAYNDNRLRI